MKGKDICERLREIRSRIAEANDIDYTPADCSHEGECSGTCPRCESEVRYIERQLRKRSIMGKTVALAGLALGAAAFMPIQARQAIPATIEQTATRLVDAAPNDATAVVIRGRVIDKNDREPLIGATVLLDGTKSGTATDIDGNFAIRVPKGGKLKFLYVGYKEYVFEVKQSVSEAEIILDDIALDFDREIISGIVGAVEIQPKMPAVDADIYEPR